MTEPAKILRRLGPVLVVVIFVAALWLLHHELKHYQLHDIQQAFADIPASRVWLAVGLTAANYLILMGYDWLAIRSIHHPLPFRRIALASFAGFVTSYNFGALLGGTSVRYRLYSAWGLSAVDILRLFFMLGLTFWFGLFALAGIVILLSPFPLPAEFKLLGLSVRPLGALLLVLTLVYLWMTVRRFRPIPIRGADLLLPGPRTAALQIIITAADLIVAAATLYVLLPQAFGMGFVEFMGVYSIAVMVSIFSHVPGGVGVFELTVLKLAGAEANEAVVAALLVFRIVYYLLPLLLAALLLAGREVQQHRAGVKRLLATSSRAMSLIVPSLLSFATFICGAVLLLFGALPEPRGRLTFLKPMVPLPLVEMSHFLGSLTGAALLVLAQGLKRRLDSAWWFTVGLLGAGSVFSLLRGWHYEVAVVLAMLLVAVVVSRQRFYRKGSLIHAGFTRGWVAAMLLVVVCATWLGFFAHRHVEYQSDLWWTFTLYGHASRFLRATAGVVTLLLMVAVGRLLARPTRPSAMPSAEEIEIAARIVPTSRRTDANLALLGDKSLLFNDNHSAFIMYAIHGRSWVSMGDPVGPIDEREELIWQFRELVDAYDGRPVFYEVGEENLTLYIDQGLTLLKVGEQGRVPLEQFSLEGAAHKGLRQTLHRFEREHCTFEILSRESVTATLPDLKVISDAWLAEKALGEKGFSLGFFQEPYLRRFPCAVVRREGELLAFANIWAAAEREEVSVDLMRYRPGSPSGVMEYLFTELMLWGKAEGFRWFNLGMAPLSGMEDRPLSPTWNKAMGLVFRHGEQFYGFRGLRTFKEKFGPQWTPRYLASPGGLALPRILADVTALIHQSRKSKLGKLAASEETRDDTR